MSTSDREHSEYSSGQSRLDNPRRWAASYSWCSCGSLTSTFSRGSLKVTDIFNIKPCHEYDLCFFWREKYMLVYLGVYYKLMYVLPSATTNVISILSICYKFRPYWPSSGIKYMTFKTQNKMHTYILNLWNIRNGTTLSNSYVAVRYGYFCISLLWVLELHTNLNIGF